MAITEFAGGNGRSYSSDVGPFGTPPVANDNSELLAGMGLTIYRNSAV